MTLDDLRHNYDLLTGRATPASQSADYVDATPEQTDEATLNSYTEEIAKYCEIANHLASLSPQDYASASQEELMIDSVLHQAIEYYFSVGGTEERLKKYPNYQKLDRSRSRKLNEEYLRNHPEFNM